MIVVVHQRQDGNAGYWRGCRQSLKRLTTVITFFSGPEMPVFLLNVFAKNEKIDLSAAERSTLKKVLSRLVDAYRGEARLSGSDLRGCRFGTICSEVDSKQPLAPGANLMRSCRLPPAICSNLRLSEAPAHPHGKIGDLPAWPQRRKRSLGQLFVTCFV